MKVSYRVSLVVAIPILVVLSGGLIAWRSLGSTLDNVRDLADDLFREVAHLTAARAQGHVQSMVPIVVLLGASLGNDPEALRNGELAREVIDAFQIDDDLTRISFVGADGRYVSLHHDPDVSGGLCVDEGMLDASGHLHVTEHHVVDDGPGPVRTTRDEEDPRQLPFFAPARDAGRRIWIRPRHLEETSEPGITCAVPVVSEDDEFLGVLSMELGLDALERFVTELEVSDDSRVMLLDEAGSLLAHPVGDADAQDTAEELTNIAEIDDAPIHAFALELQRHGGDDWEDHGSGMRYFEFEVDGAIWLANTLEFEVDEGVVWRVACIAPEDDFLGFVDDSIRESVFVAIGALLLAVLASLFIASRVSRPLAGIATQMAEVGRFELSGAPPKPSVFLEIAAMQGAVASMKGGLRSFASYVPRDVVRAVLASGQEAKLGGSVREVTMFFSDLAGFTSVSEKVTPNELVELLSGYLDAMTNVIASNGGTVDKFMGDGIMAIWGAPNTQEDHAALACEAAIRCQRRLDEMRTSDPRGLLAVARTRIGIASGAALVGNVGTPERMNYTAMGDTVNLAARLEAQNKSYGTEILVSEATFLAAKSRVLGRPLDIVAVKGKELGVRVYALVGLVADARDESYERTLAIIELSGKALEAYLAREFEKAAGIYSEILALDPHDSAAAVMKARAQGFVDVPPPAEWSGVYVSLTK